MNIGDLVTWKLDVYNNKAILEYGIVIGYFNGKTSYRRNACVWVKFASGQHSHREKTLCAIEQLVLAKDIKQKRT
tara:strand:- start:168 stop:392 length:225 start_codon:yes stop_codon:yes gene_type:complete